jgi:type IV secretion system protein TrbC
MHARVVGVDLGDRKSHYCTLNNLGKVASEGSLPSTPTDFYQQFAKLPPSLIALEVGTHSRWASKVPRRERAPLTGPLLPTNNTNKRKRKQKKIDIHLPAHGRRVIVLGNDRRGLDQRRPTRSLLVIVGMNMSVHPAPHPSSLLSRLVFQALNSGHSHVFIGFSPFRGDMQNLHTPCQFCNGHTPVSALLSLLTLQRGVPLTDTQMKGAHENTHSHETSTPSGRAQALAEVAHTFPDLPCALPVYAQSTSDPWDNAVTVLKTAFTGTIANALSLVAIVVGGLMFAYGEGQSKKTIAGIVFGVGMAVGAVKFMKRFFPFFSVKARLALTFRTSSCALTPLPN